LTARSATEDPTATAEPLTALLDTVTQAPALICPDDGVTLSRDELRAVVSDLAGRLRGLGVGRGDRVALVLADGPELIELILALAELGAAAAPLNPAYTAAEYAFFLDDLAPRLLLVAHGEAAAAREAGGKLPVVELTLAARRPELTLDGAVARALPGAPAGEADDTALLLHTSGTTSRPKQVPLLQRNVVASARTTAAHYELRAADVSLAVMPLFHVHGLVGSALAQLAAGGTVIVPRRFVASRFERLAREYEVTWLSASPTFHRAILAGEPEPIESLRFVRSCSAALAPALMEQAERGYGVPMLQAYGMTEACHQMTSNPLPPAVRIPGSVGVSAGARYRIVDDAWRDVPVGALGEVAVCGPGVAPGYLNNEEANRATFLDGWFRTGDLGVIERGHLFLRGRLKELINRGGENISPAEIDEVLLAHRAVSEAVCFGVADEKYGEAVEAVVVLRDGVGEDELVAHCRRSLATYKVPRRIHTIDTIPRTATGKVQRRVVAQALAEAGK
jgi:acyl-CoA synthetase (AMP-forming)/AMP-acid ligase II